MAMYAAIYAGDFSEVAIAMKRTHRNAQNLLCITNTSSYFVLILGSNE